MLIFYSVEAGWSSIKKPRKPINRRAVPLPRMKRLLDSIWVLCVKRRPQPLTEDTHEICYEGSRRQKIKSERRERKYL